MFSLLAEHWVLISLHAAMVAGVPGTVYGLVLWADSF